MEKIINNGRLLGYVIKSDYSPKEEIEFLTPQDLPQQTGIMRHGAGYVIKNHYHNPVHRDVVGTPEAIIVRSGKIRVLFFDDAQKPAGESILSAGDMVFLVSGGHGFEFLEESVILEIKQGPYVSKEQDKVQF
jgi:hypothetical protein